MKIITMIMTSTFIGISGSIGAFAHDYRSGHQDSFTDCIVEAEAFTQVADLAYLFREDGEVFAGAIQDLREQLLDCLATSDGIGGKSVSPADRTELRQI